MNRDHRGGLVLCIAGAYLAALGLILLALPCGYACGSPTSLTETTYFLASMGGLLVVTGVWNAGIGRKKIVAEGGWLVIGVGAAVSTLGFLFSNAVPEAWGEIGIFLGLTGSALVAYGLIKVTVGGERPSTAGPAGSRWGKSTWSRREWIAFGLLTVMLVAATSISITVYQNSQGSCNYCGCGGIVVPCPGRELLNMESYTFNSPTNVTLDIRGTGSVSVFMMAYYVKDSAGDTYSSANWSGQTVVPNALAHTNIYVDGSAVTFRTANTYTIVVITSRNNQFTFTVVM